MKTSFLVTWLLICHEKTCLLHIQNQLRGNGAADQHLYFHYIDSIIPFLNPKFQASNNQDLLWLWQFVSDLVRNPKDRFSRDTAHGYLMVHDCS